MRGCCLKAIFLMTAQRFPANRFIEIARLARIVDERDGLFLHEKLTKAHQMKVKVAVGDAIDDEPYVSSQLNPLLFLEKEAGEGLRLAAKAVGNPKIYFAIYKNLSDVDLKIKIPKNIDGVEIRRIHGRYPLSFGRWTILTVTDRLC